MNGDNMDEGLWTLTETAKKLGMSSRWIEKQIAAGKFPHRKLGASLRFSPADVRRWLASQPGRGP
jgi:excisionase family DNA binding protein